jgi:beta-N-acetylhexosaminidase
VAGAHDIIGDRAYSTDPAVVAKVARAAAEGLLAGGVLPVIKHIPGHGRARADSHAELPAVDEPLAILDKTDFQAFRPLADMPWAMTAHVLYTAIDPDRPATTSPTLVNDIIRRSIGFKGVLVSDDLSMRALDGELSDRATAALGAGCDIVLHCTGILEEMQAIARALPPMSLEAARRIAAASAMRPRKPVAIDRPALIKRLDALLAGVPTS